MCRFYIHHHQGQVMRPLRKTTCCYAALKYGYYYSYVVNYERNNLSVCGPGRSVGIATDCRLNGPGSHPGADEIFCPSRPALGPTQPPVE